MDTKISSFYLSDKSDQEIKDWIVSLTNKELDGIPELGKLRVMLDYPNHICWVNALLAVDESDNLTDVKVFDPNHTMNLENGYRDFNGWTHWLFNYVDGDHNDMTTILEDYDGVPHGF